jgi:uncharacterized protein involved in exopolysaccharide biosynthesis
MKILIKKTTNENVLYKAYYNSYWDDTFINNQVEIMRSKDLVKKVVDNIPDDIIKKYTKLKQYYGDDEELLKKVLKSMIKSMMII